MGRIRTIKPEFPRFKKRAIPANVRREVAAQYGATYGTITKALCEYCGHAGGIHWTTFSKLGWPVLYELEFDHSKSEFKGGKSTSENLVLACVPCNRAKRERSADEWQGRG